jgi:hypothetical protein
MRTCEIRWFLKTPLSGIAGWLEDLEADRITTENRTDFYLFLPGRKDLGIKIREGRLEVKHRTAPPWPKQIAPAWEGYLEAWVKYGFELGRNKTERPLWAGEDPTLHEVVKYRRAMLIHQTDGELTFGPLQYGNTTAIQLEYTKLRVLEETWYTLGLEWPEDLELQLPETFFREILGEDRLTRAESMGYAEFLQLLKGS